MAGARVDEFIDGSGMQVSWFFHTPIPYLGVGFLVRAYGGICAIEYGVGMAGAGFSPITCGKMKKG